jgi:hypothetical protein
MPGLVLSPLWLEMLPVFRKDHGQDVEEDRDPLDATNCPPLCMSSQCLSAHKHISKHYAPARNCLQAAHPPSGRLPADQHTGQRLGRTSRRRSHIQSTITLLHWIQQYNLSVLGLDFHTGIRFTIRALMIEPWSKADACGNFLSKRRARATARVKRRSRLGSSSHWGWTTR